MKHPLVFKSDMDLFIQLYILEVYKKIPKLDFNLKKKEKKTIRLNYL